MHVLGRGRAGVVHAGIDLLLDRPVAIKTLNELGRHRLYWLKREFRCLAEFSHRNFAELYDLVVADGDCFFTMELVDGMDFLARFRTGTGPHAQVDHDGVRDALAQMADALTALHAQHKLHRDIKPQNVLIDRGGRVVLLDYDLVLDAIDNGRPIPLGVAGTPIYMAPEQLWGMPPTPASDWYSVGAMTFEVLTGKTPVAEPGVLRALNGSSNAPRPRMLAPETPADLDEAVARLLEPDPVRRAGAADVLALLAARNVRAPNSSASVATPPRPSADTFAARREELATLRAAFDDPRRPCTVSIEGPAGIGKTTLIEQFLANLESESDVLVLRGRSHPREVVPFKALDAAIDELHQYVMHQPPARRAALLGTRDAGLVRLFPVFSDLFVDQDAGTGASAEARSRAFEAVRNVFVRVAADIRVVLWLDDLHWSDLDSVALLRALRREPRPPALFTIFTFRSGEPGTEEVLAAARDAEWRLEAEQRIVTMKLGPLGDAEARKIAMAAGQGRALANAELDEVVAAAGGSPLLLVELAHQSRDGMVPRAKEGGLEELVAPRIRNLPVDARQVLELVAISSGPTPEELIFRCGRPEEILRAVAYLRRERLVRRVAREHTPALDVFHSRIRDAVVACLGAHDVRRLHERMVALIEDSRFADPMLLVHHHAGAGDAARAAELAVMAAQALSEALAPNAAAAMYRKAIALGAKACAQWELEARLGWALVDAGHGADGARWLDRAAGTLLACEPESLEASRIQREAAEHYLRSGLHADGLAILRRVLAARRIVYPSTPARALGSLVFHRFRKSLAEWCERPLPAERVTAEDRETLETYWTAGVGLALFDGVRAADFNARHARWARRLSDVGHMARAAASEGLILAWEGGREKHRRSVERLRVGKSLSHASGNPNVIAHAMLMEAASAYMEARWKDAIALAAEVEELCTSRCRGAAWELANAHVMTSNSLACLGEARRLREHLARILRKASERGDQYLLVTGRLGHANCVWLMSDQPDDARRHADAALAGPFPPGYAWQVYQGALAVGQIELYVGAPEAGWEHAARAIDLMRSQHMLRFMPTRVEMLDLRARCALALAPQVGEGRRRRLIAFAARAARAIAAEDAAWAAPFARVLRAGIAARAGQKESAAELYREAAHGFAGLGMRMHAWCACHRADEMLTTSATPPHAADRDWPVEEGIVAPARIARVFAP